MVAPQKIKVLDLEKMYDWQSEVVEHSTKSLNQKILWFWGEEGTGKSTLCKSLCFTHKAILLTGNGSEIKKSIVKYRNSNGSYPSLILIDLSDSSEDEIDYGLLEEVKNGCFLGINSQMVIMNNPNIVCLSTFEPDYTMLKRVDWYVKPISGFEEENIVLEANS